MANFVRLLEKELFNLDAIKKIYIGYEATRHYHYVYIEYINGDHEHLYKGSLENTKKFFNTLVDLIRK